MWPNVSFLSVEEAGEHSRYALMKVSGDGRTDPAFNPLKGFSVAIPAFQTCGFVLPSSLPRCKHTGNKSVTDNPVYQDLDTKIGDCDGVASMATGK
jgi:hypothetical protein